MTRRNEVQGKSGLLNKYIINYENWDVTNKQAKQSNRVQSRAGVNSFNTIKLIFMTILYLMNYRNDWLVD